MPGDKDHGWSGRFVNPKVRKSWNSLGSFFKDAGKRRLFGCLQCSCNLCGHSLQMEQRRISRKKIRSKIRREQGSITQRSLRKSRNGLRIYYICPERQQKRGIFRRLFFQDVPVIFPLERLGSCAGPSSHERQRHPTKGNRTIKYRSTQQPLSQIQAQTRKVFFPDRSGFDAGHVAEFFL